ncbi:metallophosphoesterase [Chitinophaga niabensis]|uniref:Calcineurin-like phosphoesterase n=1 Tax=Chitinophaga niabensis TaxID=536979 RepID=A0A1N6IXD5_9BACT|nr:metallophosphoesterase [Chitinophaga niabensis]SIO36692.1 Calcineurin-like phosphoesterase [Chitinophaga niabensis]
MRHAFFLAALALAGCGKKSADAGPGPVTPPENFETELNTPGTAATTAPGDFTIVVLPDTQYYLGQPQLGGTPAMFNAQISWIKNNQVAENIAYVAHLGDISEHGDNPNYAATEWKLARDAIYGLENPVSIPYGLAVGNHDQYPAGNPLTSTTNYYNKYFGVKHYEGRPYYGGNYGGNNDSHYDLFSAGGMDFIVIYLEFDDQLVNAGAMNNWAYDLLGVYASRKAIIVSHSIMGNNPVAGSNSTRGNFSGQGSSIYERLKYRSNIVMMINGHHGDNGEGYRADTFEGHTIHTFLSDYQSRPNGGGGMMRLYKFAVASREIRVKTFSPVTGVAERDGDSEFTVAF